MIKQIAEWLKSLAGPIEVVQRGKPDGCTCVWFNDENGPYRSIRDVNCLIHEGN